MPADLALAARATGLATHLVARVTLERLAGADDVPDLVRGLGREGVDLAPIGDGADAAAVDRAVGATAARHLRTLERWRPARPGVLDVFEADQDRRSLRALLRGAVQAASAAERLDGLLPTRTLPRGALTALASEPSAAAVVKRLLVLAHPDAPRLLPVVRQAHPDLLKIEVSLLQCFAERAGGAARRDGILGRFVGERIDVANVQNALLLANGPRESDPGACFVEGGRWLSRSLFVEAAGAEPARARTALRHGLRRTPFGGSIVDATDNAAGPNRAIVVATLEHLRGLARREPLGTASVLFVLMRIEAQSHDLRVLAWGAALGTPPAWRRRDLVTP